MGEGNAFFQEIVPLPFPLQEILELSGAGGVAEFTKRFGFDLSYTLSCNIEIAADFLKGSCSAVVQTEAEAEHLFLSGGKGIEHVHELFFKQHKGGGASSS